MRHLKQEEESEKDNRRHVQTQTNGGLTLRHVTKADSGNYTVEINGHDASGSSFTGRNTVHVLVADNLTTSDHQLHVTQSPRAVYDDVTDQWSLQLSCGNFTFTGQPPFSVEWVMPSGIRYNSSGYHDDQFYLLVPNPVEGGNYTCQIPQHSTALACLSAGHDHAEKAVVVVDGLLVRLMLVEAEQGSLRQHLKDENERLTQKVSLVQQENQRLAQKVSTMETNCQQQQCKDRIDQWTNATTAMLTDRLQSLTDTHHVDNLTLTGLISAVDEELQLVNTEIAYLHRAVKLQTSFHVKLSEHAHLQHGAALILSTVITNSGGYNTTTGVFTAPYDGTYFFIASAGSVTASEHDAFMELMVDNSSVATAFAHRVVPNEPEMATCHAVVRLTQGQRVSLLSIGASYFNDYFTFFSGFLVSQ